MSHVAVEKVNEKKGGAASLLDEIKALSDRIRQRAYEIFQGRGGGDGFAANDWAAAERDLFRIPESELIEQDGKFKVEVSAPGFDPADVRVTALPDALIVRASSTHKHEGSEGDVCFCEFGQKALFRRFDLREPINVDKVNANLDQGVLHLTASKAKPVAAKEEKAVAA
jgi:HSP20 family protein